jgi:hypothetical protein
MKNLKRTLCLVLAVIMVCGLFAISANAAFTDESKIEYKDASQVLDAMGVITGYPDGTFKPEGTLTRAEGAYLIATLVLGPEKTKALKGTAEFTDVPANYWAAGAINYCVGEGWIRGNGDGTFDPEGKLTVVMFGALCAEALGYDAAREGFAGAEWKSKINTTASKAGLFADIPADIDADCTRDIAAKMALNTLMADLVHYDTGSVTVEAGGAVVTVGGSGAKKTEEASKLYTGTGASEKNGKYQKFADEYYKKLHINLDKTNGNFGRPAEGQWEYDGKAVTMKDKTDNLKATYTKSVTKKALYELLGSTVADDYKLNVALDGVVTKDATKSDYLDKTATASAKGTGAGVTTEVYVDSDAKLITIVEINQSLAYAGKYNSTNKELPVTVYSATKNGTSETIKLDDVAAAKDIKEKTWLIVSFDDGKIVSAEPATVAQGEIKAYTANKNVTVDGTTYSFNANVHANFKAGNDKGGNAVFGIGNEGKFILDKTGLLIGLEQVATTETYVFVSEIGVGGTFGDTVAAKVYFTDGTYQVINVSKVDGAVPSSAQKNLNKLYTYTEKDGKYELKTATSGVVQEINQKVATSNNKKSIYFVDGSSKFYGSEATKFLVIGANNKVTTYTGYAKLPTINSDKSKEITVAAITNRSGFATTVFVNVAGATSTAADETRDHIFVYKATKDTMYDSVKKDGYNAYANVLLNGEKKTIKTTDTATTLSVGLFTGVTYDSDGYYMKYDSSKSAVATCSGNKVKYAAGVLMVDSTDIRLASSCKVNVIINGTLETAAWSAEDLAGKDYTNASFYAITNSDGAATYLYVTADKIA